MKSFRLDPNSFGEAIEVLPGLAIEAVLFGGLAYFGLLQTWGWSLLILLTAANLGYALRGIFAGSLHRKYPHAQHHWLLSIGIIVMLICAPAGVLFPKVIGSGFDLAWLAISFSSILAFVLLNRGKLSEEQNDAPSEDSTT